MFDDAARVANGALGTLAGLRREAEAQARQQFERLLAGLDLVTRDEFEAVKAMAAKARAEQEALAKRLDALEKAAVKTPRPRKPRPPKSD
jgi:BMFP domain-containing protein YqiC